VPQCLIGLLVDLWRMRRHSSSLIILVPHLHRTSALMAVMREEHGEHV